MPDGDVLSQLCEWYAAQCNGRWERGAAISIGGIDNPGWMVEIDLRGSRAEGAIIPQVSLDRGDGDWMRCFERDGRFIGVGDVSKLSAILEHFLRSVGQM